MIICEPLTGEWFIYLIGVADVLQGGAAYFSWESIPRNDTCEVSPNRELGVRANYNASCSPVLTTLEANHSTVVGHILHQ